MWYRKIYAAKAFEGPQAIFSVAYAAWKARTGSFLVQTPWIENGCSTGKSLVLRPPIFRSRLFWVKSSKRTVGSRSSMHSAADWIVRARLKMSLKKCRLGSFVNIVDRFLSLSNYQVLGRVLQIPCHARSSHGLNWIRKEKKKRRRKKKKKKKKWFKKKWERKRENSQADC